MNVTPYHLFQKYYAQGHILISADAMPLYEPAASRQLRAPGMMTLIPKFDTRRFVSGLVCENIPLKDAQIIAQSIEFIEKEAYCVPKMPGDF
jgi:hypothetical protein